MQDISLSEQLINFNINTSVNSISQQLWDLVEKLILRHESKIQMIIKVHMKILQNKTVLGIHYRDIKIILKLNILISNRTLKSFLHKGTSLHANYVAWGLTSYLLGQRANTENDTQSKN